MRKFLGAVIAVTLMAVLALPALATQGTDHKATICHRTASDTNPYVYESVDVASLDAHLNNLPGHPAKEWKTDGTFRGVAHQAGDLKNDYIATKEADCEDTAPSPSPSVTPSPSTEPTPTPSQSASPTPTPTTEPSFTPQPTTSPTTPPATPRPNLTPPPTDTEG